jgi:putative chitinase
MIDRKVFFEGARNRLFRGTLAQPQVDGMTAILDEWDRRALNDIRHLAYMLATTLWETNKTMQPVREAYWLSEEWRRNNLRYYPYYGRGFVQLTWKENYEKQGRRIGIDLAGKPDLAMDLKVAADVMFHGMEHGDFTGKKLVDYFGPETSDWVTARKIINGLDRAEEIAVLGRTFHEVLKAATERKAA